MSTVTDDMELTDAELELILQLRELSEKESKFVAGTVRFLLECREQPSDRDFNTSGIIPSISQ